MRHNQNRRSRGRNRKGPNPLTRNYESNGPDVKVRGTAMHVADRYMSLARDALSSGDTVAAENYFQHAEHYNRIVMAAQAQMPQPQPYPAREYGDRDYGDDGDDDEFGAYNGRNGTRADYEGFETRQPAPQPVRPAPAEQAEELAAEEPAPERREAAPPRRRRRRAEEDQPNGHAAEPAG
ncbi:DUF4167 domain-containing protein, partial [Propylenella binzhouense]